jgi:rhodanese-related sulfurtransferase
MVKQKLSPVLKTVLISIVSSIVISSAVGYVVYQQLSKKPSKDQLIAEFYDIENAVYVSPHGLRKSMDKGEQHYTIVDLRSQQEYEKEHVVGAVNIPAYSDPDTSAYGEVDRIVAEFKNLPKDKEIVVYCYSMPCMTGRKIGKMLTEHGIYVKHLGIGWNEWRYYWNLWNHELEWDKTNVEDYVVTGKEPGKAKKREGNPLAPCTLDNTFGC